MLWNIVYLLNIVYDVIFQGKPRGPRPTEILEQGKI